MRRRLLLVALVVVGALVAGGIALVVTGDDDPRTAATSAGPGGEAEEPRDGGRLTLALERPRSLDPATADRGLQSELIVADLLFDGLTALDPDTLEAVPAVAGSWTADSERRLWSFTLDPAATFHDGDPVTADDVRFSLERVAQRGQSSSASVQLELVDGYREFAIDGAVSNLRGVIVKDPRTVEIQLVRPLATFPELLAAPAYGIVPRDAVGPVDPPFEEEPVGSGPFRLESRTEDQLRLLAAEGHDPHLDAVVVDFFDDATDAYEAFVVGDADFARVPAEDVEDAAARFGTAAFAPYGAELFYGINLRNPKYEDLRFREAIVRAVDRDAIVADVYGGVVSALESVVPAGVPGHVDGACGGCRFDPDRARELIAEVFPEGNVPVVRLDFDEGSPQDAIAEHVATDLRAVGIPVELRPKPFSQPEGSDEPDYQTFVASGDQEIFRLGWIGSYPSPDVYLTPLFTTGSPDNVVGFSSEEVDALLAHARRTADRELRHERFATAERKILEKFPIIPLVQFQTHGVTSPRVRGLELTVGGTFDITRVWVTSPE